MDVAFLVPEASEKTMLKVLIWQLGSGVVLAAAFWFFGGKVAGYSALLGSLTALIPNAFLALRLAVPRRDPGARALIQAAYIGELGKLALTVVMFSHCVHAGATACGGTIVCRIHRYAAGDLCRFPDA